MTQKDFIGDHKRSLETKNLVPGFWQQIVLANHASLSMNENRTITLTLLTITLTLWIENKNETSPPLAPYHLTWSSYKYCWPIIIIVIALVIGICLRFRYIGAYCRIHPSDTAARWHSDPWLPCHDPRCELIRSYSPKTWCVGGSKPP